MKYYLLNKEECKKSIWTNPILVKTKSLAKINKYKKLLKTIDKLQADIYKELKLTNKVINDTIIHDFLENTGTEVSVTDYNLLYGMPLYDTQEQRIKMYNKTTILKGKLFGDEVK